jgi:hypothetical protein
MDFSAEAKRDRPMQIQPGNQIEFDYFRLMKMVAAAGFRGIVAIEWEGKKLDPVAGGHASKRLIERALAALARRFHALQEIFQRNFRPPSGRGGFVAACPDFVGPTGRRFHTSECVTICSNRLTPRRF